MKKFLFSLLIISTFLELNAQEISIPETQRYMITKRTATWCPFCGEWGWTLFKGILEDNSEDALVLAAHFSGNLMSQASEDITENFGGGFQPIFYLDNESVGANGGNIEVVRQEIKSQIENSHSIAPVLQSGIHAFYTESHLVVNTRSRFFQDASGEFYMTILAVEKNKVAFQSSVGDNAEHRNVIIRSFTESTFGDMIANGDMIAGTEFDYTGAIGLEELPSLDNLLIATIIWRKESDKFVYINSNVTETFTPEVTSSIENKLEESSYFNVYPSLVTNGQVAMEIKVPQSNSKTQIDITDLNGKLVTTVFQGSLDKGDYIFSFQPNSRLQSGIYTVRVLINQHISVRRFILN